MDQTIQDRFRKIQKEYKKGKRKLEKLQRKSIAKAHVQQKLREQAGIEDELTHSRQEEAVDNSLDSRNSSLEFSNISVADGSPMKSDEYKLRTLYNSNSEKICDKEKVSGREANNSAKIEETESIHFDNIKRPDKVGDEVDGKNNDKQKFVSNSERKGALILPSDKGIPRTLSLTKYKNRNHVIKLSGGSTSPQFGKGSPSFPNSLDLNAIGKSDNDKQSLSLQKRGAQFGDSVINPTETQVLLKKINNASGKKVEPDTHDSEAIIFERRKTCCTKQKRLYDLETEKGIDSETSSLVKIDTEGNILNVKSVESLFVEKAKVRKVAEIDSQGCTLLKKDTVTDVDSEESVVFKSNTVKVSGNEESTLYKRNTVKEIDGEEFAFVKNDTCIIKDIDSEEYAVVKSDMIKDIDSEEFAFVKSDIIKDIDSKEFAFVKNKDSLLGIESSDYVSSNSDIFSNSTSAESSQISENCSDDVIRRSLSRKKRRSRTSSGPRRMSNRVACLNKDGESEDNRVNPNLIPKKLSKSKKQDSVMISSMFQCLIDNIKRDSQTEDFKLTSEYHTNVELKFDQLQGSSNQDEKNKVAFISSEEHSSHVDHKSAVTTRSEHEDVSDTTKSEVNAPLIEVLHESTASFNLANIEEKGQSELSGESYEIKAETSDAKELNIVDLCVDKRSCSTNIGTPNAKLNHSQTGMGSPTLFESPTSSFNNSNSFINIDRNHCSQTSRILSADTVSDLLENVPEECRNGNTSVYLEQKVSLEIPSNEVVLSVVSTVTNSDETYVICLCTQYLRFYCCKDLSENTWSNVLNYTLEAEVHMKKNSGGRLHALLMDEYIGVLLQHPKTSLTSLHLYLYQNATIEHVLVDSVRGKSVNIKSLDKSVFCVSHFSSPSSQVTKYTYKPKSWDILENTADDWERFSLDPACGLVTCLVKVENLESALIGLTVSRKLHIWNHQIGVILCTIDIGDVCAKDIFCPTAISEQGYLFLPMLGKKKGQEIGSVIVVNPVMSSSETLLPLQPTRHTWNGCYYASVLSGDILCVRETTGEISLWDIYNGDLLSTLDTTSSTCFTATSNHMAYVCKNILQVYSFRNMNKEL